MGDWVQARVSEVRGSGEGLYEVRLDVAGTPVGALHRRPGQYVAIRLPGQEGLGESYFAIASPPGSPRTLELLVKCAGGVSDGLAAAAPGERVELRGPLGAGFPLEQAHGRDLMLFATGSAIGAVRSIIGAVLRDRGRFGEVTLYFGARSPDAFAYTGELALWERAGIRTVRTVSRPGARGWEGLRGYVQEHIPNAPNANAAAFLCGQPEMVAGVTRVLSAHGFPQDRIYLNV